MKPHLILGLFNVGAGVSLGSELSGDFGDDAITTLSQVTLEVRGDAIWDVDRQQLEHGKVVAVALELDGGDHDHSQDLTSRVNRAIAKISGVNMVRLT